MASTLGERNDEWSFLVIVTSELLIVNKKITIVEKVFVFKHAYIIGTPIFEG